MLFLTPEGLCRFGESQKLYYTLSAEMRDREKRRKIGIYYPSWQGSLQGVLNREEYYVSICTEMRDDVRWKRGVHLHQDLYRITEQGMSSGICIPARPLLVSVISKQHRGQVISVNLDASSSSSQFLGSFSPFNYEYHRHS